MIVVSKRYGAHITAHWLFMQLGLAVQGAGINSLSSVESCSSTQIRNVLVPGQATATSHGTADGPQSGLPFVARALGYAGTQLCTQQCTLFLVLFRSVSLPLCLLCPELVCFCLRPVPDPGTLDEHLTPSLSFAVHALMFSKEL